jgi:hypothetical protein
MILLQKYGLQLLFLVALLVASTQTKKNDGFAFYSEGRTDGESIPIKLCVVVF